MKRYILFTEQHLRNMLNGDEIKRNIDGKVLYFMSKERFAELADADNVSESEEELTFIQFNKEVNRISEQYGLAERFISCYLVNWEDTYICHTHDDGCPMAEECHKLHEKLKGETK